MKRSYKTTLKILFGIEIGIHIILGVAFVVASTILRFSLKDLVLTQSQFGLFSWIQLGGIAYFAIQIIIFIIFYYINKNAKVLD